MSCRLVPHQQHEKISQLFIDYVYSVVPDYVTVKVTPMHGGDGYVCPIDMPAYKIAERAYEKAFGKRPLAVRRGGSIPVIAAQDVDPAGFTDYVKWMTGWWRMKDEEVQGDTV